MALPNSRSHGSCFCNDYGCGRRGDWPSAPWTRQGHRSPIAFPQAVA